MGLATRSEADEMKGDSPQSSTRRSTPSSPPPGPGGSNANRYLVRAELAAGGMGVVSRVLDRSVGVERALKRLNAETAAQAFQVDAFEREFQVLAGLDHPRIIRVFDYGVDEQGPYYTMELLEGEDMRKAAPLAPREACLYLRDVATSLALLHARRLIHRDLSPANVKKTDDGHCKLIDFGALTAFGNSRLVVGTPPAIPPEALAGAPLDQRADLYALGALAFWMLTGRHAFPAKQIDDLPELWKEAPPPPSALAEGVSKELDALVLSLLRPDALARPGSAAEVIARLNTLADLPPEDDSEAQRLAESFLVSPKFVGRAAKLEQVQERIQAALQGRGDALRIEAVGGMGRTRLLEEIGVRAQIAGASVLRVDSSMYRDANGTARAIALRLLDALPHVARDCAPGHDLALAALGRDVQARVQARGSVRPSASPDGRISIAPGSDLASWFGEVSRIKPLVIEVDNVDDADDASLGLLVGLSRLSPDYPLLLVLTERVRRDPRAASGLVTLRSQCERISLAGLSPAETLELTRSLFGETTPNVERFAEWLHGRTAGSPLHCVEICRQLVARKIVRLTGGMWTLPLDRPDAEIPAALEDTLGVRIDSLTTPARELAECLSLQRERPTLELCRLLVGPGAGGGDDRRVVLILDELARSDVLYADLDGYRFSSMALREALLNGMSDVRREKNHRRLGEAFARLAGPDDHRLGIEAGWHLIRGGDDVRGAEMIAAIASDSVAVRRLVVNLYRAGEPLDAALHVYKRHRRSVHERMPLLAAMAHAGYYEDRRWGEVYGDDALDALEDLAGIRMARNLQRVLGGWLGLILGMVIAFVRFQLMPKRERGYSFRDMLVQLFGAVTTLTGMAALSLDVERATRVADVLDVFAVLPERLTPVGIYQFCSALREIGREQQAAACATFDTLLRRCEDPHYYPTLPADARAMLVNGIQFALASFALFRADGRDALECADDLERSGLKLYAPIASQIRYLYYANRGEFAKAAPHREQVELHAAHVGQAWQVETWEAPALIPVYTLLFDVVNATRVADRLEVLARSVPSLKLYRQLARLALGHVRGDGIDELATIVRSEFCTLPARSFIGWASVFSYLARGLNDAGRYAEAKAVSEQALAQITDVDREYVSLFLNVDLQMAIAEAGCGDVDGALARLDGLLDRFREHDHPLLKSLLYEARGRVTWMAGKLDEYRHAVAMMEHWARPTGTPALIAKWERLAELEGGAHARRAPPVSDAAMSPDAKTDAKTDASTGTDAVTAGPQDRVPTGSSDTGTGDARTVALDPRRRETA
jgi:hypothetical protein